MRIALMSWESLHSIRVGGVAAHVSELADGLYARGHDVHLFTRLDAGQRRYECVNGVHYHRCPFNPDADFGAYVGRMCDSMVARLVEAEAFYDHTFDVVHAHDWMCVRALIKAKNDLGRHAVLTLHSTEYGRCGNTLANGRSERVRSTEWEGAYVADRVICVSCALLDEARWLYQLPAEKASVIYNGVDVHRFDADTDVARVRSGMEIGGQDPVVLFVGRMAWQKGPDLLVESMPGLVHYHPRAKFVFAGDGDMRGQLERRVEGMGLRSAARFVGYRSPAELVGMYKAADVVCVPSRNEPFGIVILESWGAAKPVVVTRNGGPAEFVRHGETGWVVSDNRDSIGWGVGTALRDLDAAGEMGCRGRRTAETKFSWDAIAERTESVYGSLN
ncbi:MAG: glycosyltransferase family 4 protein [Phycisphaerales bacterium]|nr:glycosyltransferase family 4 protein [Phycisphaerales bacterium]